MERGRAGFSSMEMAFEALVELDHAVGRGVGDLVGVDDAAVGTGVAAQLGAHAGAVEDVVAQDQGGDSTVPDEVRASTKAWARPLGSCWTV